MQSDEWYFSLDCSQLHTLREALDKCYRQAGFVGKMMGECKTWNDYYVKCVRQNYKTKQKINNAEGRLLQRKYEAMLKRFELEELANATDK